MKNATTAALKALGISSIILSAVCADHAVAQTRTPLVASAQAFRANVAIVGDAADQTAFPFQVALKMRDAETLYARVGRGETISDSELTLHYLPTAKSYDTVLSWLRSSGFSIVRTYANRLTVEVVGPVRTVRQALQVPMRRVQVEGTEFVATDAAPVVPNAIASLIDGINGLQPYLHLNKMSQLRPSATVTGSVHTDSIITGDYFPAGILAVYQALPYLAETGKGTTTAILIDTFPNATDVANFWSLTGVPQSLSNITFIQTVAGTLPRPSGEESLDTEWASSIGYGSKVRVYATKSLAYTNLDTGYQAILSDLNRGVSIQQMSVSLGGCEVFVPLVETITERNLLTLIAAKNVSIFVSSGDSGSHECGSTNPNFPSWPSTNTVVTAVGGTHLLASTVGSDKLVINSETGWTGSGGGFSNLFTAPSYQSALRASVRVVPDVAAVADPATGVAIILNGQSEVIGGTSASSPIWAGFMSLVNQARATARKKPLGQLNPRIYGLLGSGNFHDDTAGCNGAYCAIRGYDLVTGIGSPVMNRLLPTLVAQP